MRRLFNLSFVLLLLHNCNDINAEAQVDQEIYDLEDLLAVESEFVEENVVNPHLIAIEPAPPGFGGERLTGAPVAHGGADNHRQQINPDGSYSFRYQCCIL